MTPAPESCRQGLPNKQILLLLGVTTATWGWVLFNAHYFWGSESYYNFGWFVPVLVLFLGYRRLTQFGFAVEFRTDLRPGYAFAVPLLAAVFLYGAARLFNEANPFWRVPLWAQAISVLTFSCSFIWLYAGKRGMLHLGFCLIVLLMALPWPWRIEQAIIQSLTGWVTQLTVLVLNFLAYPAVATGNVIQIGEIRLGVDEACSGIRSLQAIVLVALFIGEFFYFRLGFRLLLLGWAIFLVLLFNGLRAFTLALVFLSDNAAGFQFWHDFLGNANFIASCLLLFAAGEMLARLVAGAPPTRPPIAWKSFGLRTDLRLALACFAGFFAAEALVRGYYAVREANSPALPRLNADWDLLSAAYVERKPVPPVIEKVLQFDYGEQIEVQWADGVAALITHYGYTGEDRMASVTSYAHSPAVCMAGLGGQLGEEKPLLEVRLNGQPWPVEHFDFHFSDSSRQQSLQVFWLIWQPRDIGVTAADLQSLNWRTQLALVANGRRIAERQVIFIRFSGQHPDEVLRSRVQQLLERVTTPRD